MSGLIQDNNQINFLVEKAAEGDDEAMAMLIKEIMPAAEAKASALNSGYSRISDDDLIQEGMIGFLEAVKRFDVSKGVPFKAYASLCIESRIKSALRENNNSGNASLTGAVSIDGLPIETDKFNPVAITESNEAIEIINDLADNVLSSFEKKVLELKLAEHSYSDIAAELECSEKSVDNALQRIRKKLRDTM